MGPNQREIKRRIRVLKHAEKIGNVHMTCRYFGLAHSFPLESPAATQNGLASGCAMNRSSSLSMRSGLDCSISLNAIPFPVKIHAFSRTPGIITADAYPSALSKHCLGSYCPKTWPIASRCGLFGAPNAYSDSLSNASAISLSVLDMFEFRFKRKAGRVETVGFCRPGRCN